MSLSERESRLFLGPLEGRATAFRLKDRQSNLRFASGVLRLLLVGQRGCSLLDLDGFYSSNLETVAARLPPDALARFEITVPEPGSDTETILSSLFREGGDKPLLVDSVNSLYQLLSLRNPRSTSRKFGFFASALSGWAKSNGKPVIATIYDRRPAIHRRVSRSLTDVFDTSVSISTVSGGLAFKCERGGAWRGGSFFLPLEDGEVEAHEHRDGNQEQRDTKVKVHQP